MLIPTYASCSHRMTPGERRFAQRLESLLESFYLCWYDVPIGTKYQHPDFVLLHPSRGFLVLEVKDWQCEAIQSINRVSATLITQTGAKAVANPLFQARRNAFALKNALERDAQLIAPVDHPHHGKLICPYGYGAVLSGITRKQFDGIDLGSVLPSHLVICKDEMTEGMDPEKFRERLWGIFNVQFSHALTLSQIDRIRWHMFPELRISQGNLFETTDANAAEKMRSETQLLIMDLQQERLARSLGEGHRVIHGVAGSGKTLILTYRCEQLAKSAHKPILVLCFNVALAAKLQQSIAARGLGEKVVVRNFHRWCLDQITLYHAAIPEQGDEFFEELVSSVRTAVERGQIPRAQYAAVLIDEGHDFEAGWFALITQMIDPETDSLLLLYDDAQSIYGKPRSSGFSFKRVGIQAQGRTTILRVNYRNTDEIQHCAYDFAKDILTPASAEDDGVPLLKPEMAGRHGPTPELIRVDSLEAEAKCIVERFKLLQSRGTPWNQMAALYKTRFVADELASELTSAGIPFEWMKDRNSKRFDPLGESVKVMTLHSSKGLEFPVVAIIGLGFMPHVPEDPSDDARLLYVGMTRATERLVMTASRDSIFVRKLSGFEAGCD